MVFCEPSLTVGQENIVFFFMNDKGAVWKPTGVTYRSGMYVEEDINPNNHNRTTTTYRPASSGTRHVSVAIFLQRIPSTTTCKISKILRSDRPLGTATVIPADNLTAVNIIGSTCLKTSSDNYDTYFAQPCSVKNQTSSAWVGLCLTISFISKTAL